MKAKQWYVADFETTSEHYYNENGFTKVWLFSICDSNAIIYADGTTIDDFIKVIKKLCGKVIYFHNLKFDGSFIIDYLLKNDYEYVEDLGKVDKGISAVIDDMGSWYTIDIKFSKGRVVHIHDSLKLLPFKVAKIAKDFGLPILKEHIDYDNYEVTPEKWEYIHHDVQIVAMALAQIKAEGMTRLTTASCAYNMYTDNCNPNFIDDSFPELPTDFLVEWRKAYRGGRSQVNPLHRNEVLTNVRRYDINSMYPYVMYSQPLPYGMPIPITEHEMNTYRFELYQIEVEFVLKDNHLPSLLKKGSVMNLVDSYYIQTEGTEALWISSVDYELLKRNYNIISFKFIKGFGFHTSTLMFRKYIDYWYAKKQVDKGAKRIVDKLMLNSFYGKFGSNVMRAHKIPKIDSEIVSFENSKDEESKHYYLPIAIGVVSWAHKLIDDAIHYTGIQNFVYCDTDSVHTLGTLPNDIVDSKKLGKFKLEAVEEKCKYVRQKCYVTKEADVNHITCAGMPEEVKARVIEESGEDIWKIFGVGLKVNGKLVPRRVKGGVILHGTSFKITE